MCMMSPPKVNDPQIATQTPTEYAASRSPDQSTAAAAGDQTKNRMRAAASTVLTSNSGVTQGAATQKKTLLGA